MTYSAIPITMMPNPPMINSGGKPLESLAVACGVTTAVASIAGEGAMVAVAVAVAVVWCVGWGVAVDVAVAVRVAEAAAEAVGVGVFVGRSVAVMVTTLVAVTVSADDVAACVVCTAFAEGLLGASICAVPIDPSTMKRGAPPMIQPPVHVAPAISTSYWPSCAVIVCLCPFQSINVACFACAATPIVCGAGWRVHATVVQPASPRFTVTIV